jgi:hypothetical protein
LACPARDMMDERKESDNAGAVRRYHRTVR